MARASSQNGKPKTETKSGYTIRVTFSSLISAGIVTLIGLGWVFMLGVIVGRGYHPEQKMPELARILPASPQQAPPPAHQAQRNDVIKAEELKFMHQLKGRPTGNNATAAQAAVAPTPKPADNKRTEAQRAAEVKAVAEAKTAADAKSASEARKAEAKRIAEAKKAQEQNAAQAAKAANETFDYIYQVAAFKEEAPAKTLRAKLESAGLRIRIESQKEGSVTWYRLLVNFRGTPEDTRNLKGTLQKQGIDKIIMRSKTPVAGKSKA